MYTVSTYNRKEKVVNQETTINAQQLKELSRSFGLPYIEDKVSISIVGYEQLLIFHKSEDTQCRLIEIY